MNILDITKTIELLNTKHAKHGDGVEYLPVNILFTNDEGFTLEEEFYEQNNT